MPSIELIVSRIARYEPLLEGGTEEERAAVAVIVRQPEEGAPEILFIERAVREGDPWSGQMAFPGGRRDAADPDLRATAVRETHEEVGLSLGEPIGRLDDVRGRRRTPAATRPSELIVSPFVFGIDEEPPLRPGPEVRDTVWIAIPQLLDLRSAAWLRLEREGERLELPAIRHRGRTIWGLTYRILGGFFRILERELPDPGPD
jgi:8-oxo-dGTP pyrophosphatase MutT (NUDIX family)